VSTPTHVTRKRHRNIPPLAAVVCKQKQHNNFLDEVGFECGDGWYKIIWELFERLEPLVAESEAEGPFEVLQVKQKMGGLRVHLSRNNAAIKEAIQVAQERSVITCELCGEPGFLDCENDWYQTLCTLCREQIQNQAVR